MKLNKLGLSIHLLFFVTTAAIISSQASGQVFVFDFDGDSAFSSGQGIGASQLGKSDAFNMANLTTVDIFAPEFADDGTGNFARTGNTLFASSGDGVTTSGSLGIDNPSSTAARESFLFNDGEGWVVEFDADVSFDLLSLISFREGTLTVTIDGIGTFDFADLGNDVNTIASPFGSDFIPAGTDITFAYSSPDSSAFLRISSFTVVPASVADGIGDINQDCFVNFGDIPAFIAILASGVFDPAVDLNFDGEVTFADIPPFIAILQGA